MSDETSKQAMRRMADHRYATRWIKGNGIDIGCGKDPLSRLAQFYPLMQSLRPWDLPDGDAMLMAGIAANSYDFVHSSHCLEHLTDPVEGLRNWIRICRPGGHLVITVPDEDLYEQGIWPSTFNGDHKWSFTIDKPSSWSPKSVSLLRLLEQFRNEVEILKIELLDAGFLYGQPRQDQSRSALAESAIEFVLRKRTTGMAGIDTATLHAQAQALQTAGEPDKAVTLYRQILERQPDHLGSWLGLGEIQRSRGLFDEAIEAFRQALSLAEKPADLFCQLGELYMDTGHTQEAVSAFGKAINHNPEHVQAHVYQGFACLKLGDFARGADGLSWIYRNRGIPEQRFLFRDKAGNPVDLTQRRVILSADAGLGDTLMFIRYARLLKEQGATVVAEVQPELVRLIQGDADVDEVVPQGGLSGKIDFRVPLHNLIGAFGTTLETIPAAPRYLAAPADEAIRFGERLATLPGIKVGLAWAGNPGLRSDARRSIAPQLLAPLTGIPGITLVSLQKNGGTHGLNIVDWTDELQDMASTAALIEGLDLIISVDSAIVHLAGALGKPVWLLNRYDGCWRWLEARDDSPWYPGLHQFRQPTPGDWTSVIAATAKALAARGVQNNPAPASVLDTALRFLTGAFRKLAGRQ